jgi:cell division septation protein DedD
MEKQKVFWVVLSVSVFVVVVLVVGVLLLRQHPSSVPRAAANTVTGTGTQVYEYQREAPLTSPATGPQGNAGDQQTMHFYIGEGGTPAPGASTTAPGGAAPSTAAPSSTGPAPSAGTASSTGAAPVVHPLVQTIKPRVTKPTVQARAPRKTPDYWIQTGSYKSQSKAEELVGMLESKGLGSRVFSYASNGDTYYRVRVGPYSNKGEADKFLALVKQVQGLESSFISMVPAGKSSLN